MAWAMGGTGVAAALLLTIGAGELAPAAAEVIVLRAEGPSASRHYRTGTRHANDAVFHLRAGDSMVVLAPGGTRQWRGPGFYSVVAPARPLVLANGQQVAVRTGVVRREPPRPGVRPTDVSEYEISQPGRLCVFDGTRPLLWRPRGSAATRITITAVGGTVRSFDWARGETQVPWPAELPLRDGTAYVIDSTEQAQPVRVTLQLLPVAAARGTDALATLLLQRGCTGQLDTLIATRLDPSAPVASAATARNHAMGRR